MNPTVGMLVVVTVMFLGAAGAGILPFFFNVKSSRINLLSGVGGGLLLGTALSIVIPEGFESISREAHEHQSGDHKDVSGGLILVLGFLGMLILERAQHGGAHGHGHTHVHEGGSPRGGRAPSIGATNGLNQQMATSYLTDSAVLGLLLHCAADGLALGAAAAANDTRLSMIVSVAMLAHKAPMAFGLATFLMKRGATLQDAKPAILAFAAAAPLSAIATRIALAALPLGSSSEILAARCLLGSGGTFLYAATMHILPEVLEGATRGTLAGVIGGTLAPTLLVFLGGAHEH